MLLPSSLDLRRHFYHSSVMQSYIDPILVKKRLTKNYGLMGEPMSALNVKPEGQRDHSSLGVIYCLPEVLITGRLNGEGHTHRVTSLTSSLVNRTRRWVRKLWFPKSMAGLRTSCSSSNSIPIT